MYVEAAGFDSLGVGDVHGDGMRNFTGEFANWARTNSNPYASGALKVGPVRMSGGQGQGSSVESMILDPSLVVPVAAKNQVRSYGSLACVYLGRPK